MKKVLIFAPLAKYTPHFETELELAKIEKDAGNEVTILTCPSGLAFACHERFADQNACITCTSRKKSGVAALEGVIEKKLQLFDGKVELPQFNSIEDIKKFYFCGVDIGLSVVSTYISLYREPKLDFIKHKSNLLQSCKETINLTRALMEFLNKNKFDKVYLFNGRLMLFRPLMRILEQKKIPFFVHERAGQLHRYSLTKNTFPHSLMYKKNEISETKELLSELKIRKDGEAWFLGRRRGTTQGWPSYILNQIKDKIPKGIDKDSKTIAIFISSEDEFECMEEWNNTIYKNQYDGIVKILDDLPKEYSAVVRVHPNLKNIKNSQTKKLNSLIDRKNCILVPAEETIDSYAVLENSDKVVTFGSTMGIEATYWGKPSILAGGRSMYEHLNVCYTPSSHTEVMQLIGTKNLEAKPKENTLIYGAWEMNHGYEFKYFKPEGFNSGEFLGSKIDISITSKALLKVRKKLQKIKAFNWKSNYEK